MSKEINARKYIKEYESDKVIARFAFPLTLEDYMKSRQIVISNISTRETCPTTGIANCA